MAGYGRNIVALSCNKSTRDNKSQPGPDCAKLCGGASADCPGEGMLFVRPCQAGNQRRLTETRTHCINRQDVL